MLKKKISMLLFLSATLLIPFFLSNKVSASSPLIVRLSGENRYETNISIIKKGWSEAANVVLANGENYPDALSGSVLSSNANAPIVLMDNDLSEVTSDFLKDQNSKTINILGGTGAISSNTENILKNTVKSLNFTKVDTVSDLAFIGEDYHFPPTALVTYEDSSTKLVPVKWNGNTVDTSKAGSYNFEGTVSGYTGKVQMNLKVTEETGNINSNLVNGGYFAYYKDSLYYIDVKDNSSIYRINNSDNKITKLNSDSSAFLNIVGDHIYYSNISDYGKLYKMNLDGSEKTKIVDYTTSYFVVVGDWIYYSYKDKGISAFYKMRTDGSNNTKISNDEALYI